MKGLINYSSCLDKNTDQNLTKAGFQARISSNNAKMR